MTSIHQLEAFEVTIPLPKPLLLGAMTIAARQYAFVRVYDGEGNIGTAYGLTRGAPVAETVRRLVAPHWVGQALDIHADCYRRTANAHRLHGTHGIFWRALSLVDIAVHDLRAVRAGVPLYTLLGGAYRPIPATVAGCYPTADETPDSLAALMQHMMTYQPVAIKITSAADYGRDTERLQWARRAIPDGAPFVLDVYASAERAEDILRHAAAWSETRLLWLEDPFAFDDMDNLITLCNALPFPVGVGDEQAGLRQFARILDSGVRVMRLDATVCGGITGFLELARLAESRGIGISCHIFHHLHAQLAAALPTVHSVEYMLPETNVESIQRVMGNDLVWQAGMLLPAQNPGIGTIWDEDQLKFYADAPPR